MQYMIASIRLRAGPPHTAINSPPATPPIASANATCPTCTVPPNASTSGGIISSGVASSRLLTAKNSSIARNERLPQEIRQPPSTSVQNGSRRRRPIMSGNRVTASTPIANV